LTSSHCTSNADCCSGSSCTFDTIAGVTTCSCVSSGGYCTDDVQCCGSSTCNTANHTCT
jgi:hypothetical protein